MPKCSAHTQSGKNCGQPAINGSKVCRIHGGSAPQVKEAARRRLLALVEPALALQDKILNRALKCDIQATAAWKRIREAIPFDQAYKMKADIEAIEAIINATGTIGTPETSTAVNVLDRALGKASETVEHELRGQAELRVTIRSVLDNPRIIEATLADDDSV